VPALTESTAISKAKIVAVLLTVREITKIYPQIIGNMPSLFFVCKKWEKNN